MESFILYPLPLYPPSFDAAIRHVPTLHAPCGHTHAILHTAVNNTNRWGSALVLYCSGDKPQARMHTQLGDGVIHCKLYELPAVILCVY